MPKKSKEIEIKRLPTRHQLSKWQRQKKQQRILLIISGAFIFLILAISGFGYYDNAIRPYQEKALIVNKAEFNTGYFLDTMRYYGQGMGQDEIGKLLSYTAEAIVEGELIREAAPGLGLMPTAEELKAMEDQYGLGSRQAYKDLAATTIIANKMLTTVFDKDVPQKADQAQVQAMLLETQEQAAAITKRLSNSENFTALAKEFSIETTTKDKGGDLGWIANGIDSTIPTDLIGTLLPKLAFDLKPGVVSEPTFDENFSKQFGYWLYQVTERDGDKSAHVFGILLGSQAEAIKLKSELDSGGDFAVAAQKYSLDTKSQPYGGDLGWIQKDSGSKIIVDSVFSLPLKAISAPVRDTSVATKGGWWIIKVVNRESDRALDADIRALLGQDAFNKWLTKQRDSSTVKMLLTDDQQLWLYSSIMSKKK